MILISVLAFGVFALLTARVQSLGELATFRLLTGIGLGGAMPNIIALTSEHAPAERRASLVTAMFCGFPLGATIGGFLSAPLIHSFGWQSVFVVGGLLPLALLPVPFFFLPESIRAKPGARTARERFPMLEDWFRRSRSAMQC